MPRFFYENKTFLYFHIFLLFMVGPLSILSPRAIVWPFVLLSITSMVLSVLSYWGAPLTFLNDYFFYRRSSTFTHPFVKIFTVSSILIHMIFAKMSQTRSLFAFLILCFLCYRLVIFYSEKEHFNTIEPIFRKKTLQAFFFGILVALVLLSLDHMSGNWWQHMRGISSAKAFAHSTQILALSFWPVILFALKNHKETVNPLLVISALAGLFIYPLSFIDCDAGIYSLIFGLMGAAITYGAPRFVGRWVGTLFIGSVLASPFIALWFLTPENISVLNQYIKGASALERLYIWREAATLWLDHPLVGYGFDSAHELSKTLGTHTWSHMDAEGMVKTHTTLRLPMHPHNVFLQFFLETGILGVTSFLLCTQGLFIRLRHWLCERDMTDSNNERLYQSCIIGLFCTAFFIANVSVGAWQTWWLSALFLSCALIFLGKSRE